MAVCRHVDEAQTSAHPWWGLYRGQCSNQIFFFLLKSAQSQSTVDPRVHTECDSCGVAFHVNLLDDCYMVNKTFSIIEGHSLLRKNTREMCSAKMTQEPAWGNWRHWKCHTLTGNTTQWWHHFFYTRLSKEKKKRDKSSTNSLCLLCDGMQLRTAEVESESVQRWVRLFRCSSSGATALFFVFNSDVPILPTGTPTSRMICTKWRITSSLHPCNSQTIIIEPTWFSLAETSTQNN